MREGKLTLISPKRPTDIVIFGSIMALALVLSIAGYVSDLLTVLAFISIFFIPGYMMQAALFPSGRIFAGNRMVPDFFERIAISFVLSFLVVALSVTLITGGLGFIFFDISKDMVTSIILIVTTLAAIFAVDRRLAEPKKRAFEVVLDIKPMALNGMEKMLAIAVVVLVAAAGINAVLQASNSVNDNTFTTFAIYGPDGTIGSLPNEIIANSSTAFTIFIECKENHDVRCRMTVTLNNNTPSSNMQPMDLGGNNALENGTSYHIDIDLADGEQWTETFQFSISDPGVHKLYLLLNVPGELTRELWLWVNVT